MFTRFLRVFVWPLFILPFILGWIVLTYKFGTIFVGTSDALWTMTVGNIMILLSFLAIIAVIFVVGFLLTYIIDGIFYVVTGKSLLHGVKNSTAAEN
jgi:uncharacterized membrane protein YciS (DUF1049 family)